MIGASVCREQISELSSITQARLQVICTGSSCIRIPAAQVQGGTLDQGGDTRDRQELPREGHAACRLSGRISVPIQVLSTLEDAAKSTAVNQTHGSLGIS
ncbi:Hypothetical predicted protein [Cloeon dipterum]|uniref:Uncharacterized protein n=1 Tax=Cloeon dipterum TaxID=197152 RepID=A0A8S1C7M7_9INSE|nr:Hypothetical predicted protein [Cloeon dipterum]